MKYARSISIETYPIGVLSGGMVMVWDRYRDRREGTSKTLIRLLPPSRSWSFFSCRVTFLTMASLLWPKQRGWISSLTSCNCRMRTRLSSALQKHMLTPLQENREQTDLYIWVPKGIAIGCVAIDAESTDIGKCFRCIWVPNWSGLVHWRMWRRVTSKFGQVKSATDTFDAG